MKQKQCRMFRRKLINKQTGKLLYALLFACLLTACQNNRVYCSYHSVSFEKGWYKQDTLSYELPQHLHPETYRLEINIRNFGNYPYRDIWLSVSQNWKDSLTYKTDTIHLYLADEEGRQLDGGTTGNLHQHTYVYDKPFEILHPSSARLHIVHLMRTPSLMGISDVGVCLIKP